MTDHTSPSTSSARKQMGQQDPSSTSSVPNTAAFARAKRTPIKHSTALRKTCEEHGVVIDEANLVVCQGRKVVFVLRVGAIHSPACFLREAPTPSFKKSSGISESGWQTVVVPNGWKVAVIVDNDVWTAEIAYAKENDVPHYQFTRLDDKGNVLVRSDWQLTPSGAFKGASTDYFGDDSIWGRHNGKLYVGCTYDYPQVFLRRYFKKKLEENDHNWNPNVLTLVQDWLDPTKQSTKAVANSLNGTGPEAYTRDPISFETERITPSPAINGPEPNLQSDSSPTSESGSLDPKRVRLGSDGFSTAMGPVKRRAPRGSAQDATVELSKLESTIGAWLATISPLVNEEIATARSTLSILCPVAGVNPSIAVQNRSLSCSLDTPLTEDDINAILYRLDGHLQSLVMEKRTLPSPPERFFATQARTNPIIGYVPIGIVKRVTDIMDQKTAKAGQHERVLMLDFLATLEGIEKVAEALFPIITQTLGLFSLEDIVRRFSENRRDLAQSWVAFVQERMKFLGLNVREKISQIRSAQEFCHVMTGLPRALYIRRFFDFLRPDRPSLAADITSIGLGNVLRQASGSSAGTVLTSSPPSLFPLLPSRFSLPNFINQPIINAPWTQMRPANNNTNNLLAVSMFMNNNFASNTPASVSSWLPIPAVDPSVAAAAAAMTNLPWMRTNQVVCSAKLPVEASKSSNS